MKVYRKVMTIILITMLSFCLVCGCSLKKEQNNHETETTEPIEISWYINFSWFTTKWGGNLVSDAITDKTGLTVNFLMPTGNEFEKLDSMINSNSLPDLITLGWWETQISQMIDNGMVYALDELADEYDPYFWEVTNNQAIKWYTADDGHIYQYPNSSFTPSDYDKYDKLAANETFLVRKDIYEAIGSPDMTTPEGFINAVEKAVEVFPEVNGEKLIPIGAHEFTKAGCVSFDAYLQDFLAVPYMKDGRTYDRMLDTEYIAWLKAFRKLGAAGYLKDDIFIDTRTQMEEKIAKGQYFCMLYQRTDLVESELKLYNQNPDSIYIAVDGPKNSNGKDYTLPGTGVNGWTVTLISKQCKHPEKVIKLISYLISEEGQKMTWLGVEGKTWDYDDKGVPRMHDNVSDLLKKDRVKFDNIYGADSCYWMFQNNAIASLWTKDDPESPLTQLVEWTYPYTTYLGQYAATLKTGTEEEIIKSKADNSWGKVLPQLLLAPTEEQFDAIFDNFVEERYKIGYDKVLDAMTIEMNKNIERLGLDNE